MPVNPDKIKAIMGRLEVAFPGAVSLGELQNKITGNIDNEMVYCKRKKWIEQKKEGWRATPNGIDASLKMHQEKKRCYDVDC